MPHIVSGRSFRYCFDHVKAKFYRCFNTIFHKAKNAASELVCVQLLKSVCLPVILLPRDALSAKRGLAIACRPSVCPSVTLVICDHIGWISWKLIARTISLAPSLFVAKRRST